MSALAIVICCGGMGADVKVAVHREALPTATGNADFTTTDLGGVTPKAVMVFIGYASADATARADMACAIGFADATRECCGTCFSLDAQETSNALSDDSASSVVYLYHNGSIVSEGAFDSFITNGVRINFSTIQASSPSLATFVFFAGDDLSVYADRVDVTTVWT